VPQTQRFGQTRSRQMPGPMGKIDGCGRFRVLDVLHRGQSQSKPSGLDKPKPQAYKQPMKAAGQHSQFKNPTSPETDRAKPSFAEYYC
jgi:hypothetical protein